VSIDLSLQISQADFGATIGISRQAVHELVARGVLARGATAGEWLLAYCERLREQAAGRSGGSGSTLDLAAERALLAREQRERIAIQNAQSRRELAPVWLITEALSRVSAQLVAILEMLPMQLRRRIPEMPIAALDLVRDEINRARTVAAAIEPDLADLQPRLDEFNRAFARNAADYRESLDDGNESGAAATPGKPPP
jgi:phage terminase Nu1 subunit (DNA packaging protein)